MYLPADGLAAEELAAALLKAADFWTVLQTCSEVLPDLWTALATARVEAARDVYQAVLAGTDATLASRLTDQWLQMRTQGATSGAISTFAASPTACNAELGSTANIKAISSFVAQFAGPGQEAQRQGLFGPVVEVADEAPLLDRVIGLAGRDPAWSPR